MSTLKPKYVAEGFDEDSGCLLNEFMDMNSVEFSDFAALWRKHYFSLIFMGRPDHTETSEFVNEIYRITSQYLFTPSFYQQVGAVYLMYGLFRNQISDPPIKIRIEFSHWKIIKSLRDEAISKKYLTLHYVIDYLIDNAFLHVASQTLKGPLIGQMPKTTKKEELICNLKSTYKSDLIKYSVNNNLADLRALQVQYMDEKKKIGGSARVNLCDSPEIYDDAINELLELITPRNKVKKKVAVGDRRAKIKAESFIRKSKNRFGDISDGELVIDEAADDPDYDVEESPIKQNVKPRRTRKPRRPPKDQRRVGRPRIKPKKEPPPEPKSDDDGDIDISHLLSQQKNFYLPPFKNEKKNRTKRDPYYQLSPKRGNSDSDLDCS